MKVAVINIGNIAHSNKNVEIAIRTNVGNKLFKNLSKNLSK